MKNIRLEHHRYPPFQYAVRVHDAVLQLATTDRRLINERLFADSERLLRHVGCAAIEKKGPSQRQRLHYGRLALTTLAITVDAAERASLIPNEQAEAARGLMLAMERELIAASGEHPPNAPAVPADKDDQQQSDVPPTREERPPDDALVDLRELIDRDGRSQDTHCQRAEGDVAYAVAGLGRGG